MPYKIHTPSHVQGAEPRHALGLHVAEELREDVRALLGTPVAVSSRRGQIRRRFLGRKNPWKNQEKPSKIIQNQGVNPPKSWENHGKNGAIIYAPTMCQMGMFYEDMNGDINETYTV